MSLSVVEPINPAIERAKLVLFSPFDLDKWVRLGFCAFLASLGSGGCGGGPGGGGGGPNRGKGTEFDFEPMHEWLREYAVIIISVAAAVLVVGLLVGLLLTWLSSRGRFMLLDGVARNRGAVVQPWHEFSREGNSLCKFRYCVGLIGFTLLLTVLVVCGFLIWPDIQQNRFGSGMGLAIVVGFLGIFGLGLTMAVIGVFLTDFVTPIMYLQRVGVLRAWRVFASELWAGNVRTFLLYLLFRFVIGIGVNVLGTTAVCVTCCVAAIPYVGSVILLPLSVFVRSYSLYFIEQFGPKWQVFSDDASPPAKPLPS